MTKILVIFGICLIGACAVVEDSQTEVYSAFEPIGKESAQQEVEHGVITVRQLNPRSDIISIAPSVQHVVWQRDVASTPVVVKVDVGSGESSTGTMDEGNVGSRKVKDIWPVLSEDLNFETEFERLDMCSPQKHCGVASLCGVLEPCLEPDRYDCFETKSGQYCLERKI